MKLMLKGFLCIMLLVSGGLSWSARADDNNESDCQTVCGDVRGDVLGTKTHFSLRPQDSNAARKMTAVEDKIHCYGAEELNGVFSVGLQYQQTWKSQKLARYLFGKSTLTYGQACDGTSDLYGPNFGTLGTGRITFSPKIQNFIADLDLWVGLDEFICGLWARIDVPINWTKWKLNACQRVDTNGAGLFFDSGVLDFEGTDSVASLSGALDGVVNNARFGLVPPLACGAICRDGTHTTAVAGLHLDLGYDFYRTECSHFGASLHVVAPTGTRPNDHFLFNAVSGPQRSWQVGATINAAYELWANCDGDQSLGVYFDATITHLFESRQRRLFDLNLVGASDVNSPAAVNPLSYWLLLKKFNPDTGAVIGLERAANVLCCEVKVGAKAMADLGLMLEYNCGCFATAIGYNFWYRSQERLKNRNRDNCKNTRPLGCTGITANTYGIKGDTNLGTAAFPDNSTESTARIGNCGPVDAAPVYLTPESVNYCSGLHPKAWSNKVFGWVGYSWSDCEWQPYIALEGEAEFGKDNVAADQWAVMLKGGVKF